MVFNFCLLVETHSGATGSTWRTSRGTPALNFSLRPESWRRSGWISLRWQCKYVGLQTPHIMTAVLVAAKCTCIYTFFLFAFVCNCVVSKPRELLTLSCAQFDQGLAGFRHTLLMNKQHVNSWRVKINYSKISQSYSAMITVWFPALWRYNGFYSGFF